MKKLWDTIKIRWEKAMPKFFKGIIIICALISGTALAVNTAVIAGGGTTHEWWNELYPYLLGVPAGAAFVAKFTVNGGFRDVDYDKYRKNEREGKTILDKDDF